LNTRENKIATTYLSEVTISIPSMEMPNPNLMFHHGIHDMGITLLMIKTYCDAANF